MGHLLALALVHYRGGSTHRQATSWLRIQWASSRAQGHGAPPVVLHLSGAARCRVAHGTGQCQRTAARECAHRTASASRLPMHSVFELVCHANSKRLVVLTGTHHVPLMQQSSHLRLGIGRVIWISLAGGTPRKMRRMKIRTVTPVVCLMRIHLLSRRLFEQEHRRQRTCHRIMRKRRLLRSTFRGALVQLRGAITFPDAQVTHILRMLILYKRRPQICLMTYSNRLQKSDGPRRIAAGMLWKPR